MMEGENASFSVDLGRPTLPTVPYQGIPHIGQSLGPRGSLREVLANTITDTNGFKTFR